MTNERSQLVFCVSLMLFMHFLLPVTEMIPHLQNHDLHIKMGQHGSFFDYHDNGHVLIIHELPEHTHEDHEHDVEELSVPFSIEVLPPELIFSNFSLALKGRINSVSLSNYTHLLRGAIRI